MDYDAAYSDIKDLAKRTILDKILKLKLMKLLEIVNMMDKKRALARMVYKFFDKKPGSAATVAGKAGVSVNEQLIEELHKPIIKKFKRKAYENFKDNIWAADLSKMESLSSKNRNIKYLLCAINISTKYSWVNKVKQF